MLISADRVASRLLITRVIHRSDQLSTGYGRAKGLPRRKRAPPVAEFSTGMYCVPIQKIFAKVKAALWL